MAFGITTIRSISNFASSNVEITNTRTGQIVNIPPNQTVPAAVEIPWADTRPQIASHHLAIEIRNETKYYIFQQRGYVRYRTTVALGGWDENNTRPVPGYEPGDGDRVLSIKSDETFEVQITG
jgi:hypothetical protein